MISKKMEAALNRQIVQELSSAYAYLAMAAYFEHKNLKGFAHWATAQYKEENEHSMKLFDYINDQNSRVTLEKIATPKSNWKSIVEVFEDALTLEQHTTESINRLMALAKSEKDYATENMLQWFVEEQVEEESTSEQRLSEVKLIKDSASGLLMLDRELSKDK